MIPQGQVDLLFPTLDGMAVEKVFGMRSRIDAYQLSRHPGERPKASFDNERSSNPL